MSVFMFKGRSVGSACQAYTEHLKTCKMYADPDQARYFRWLENILILSDVDFGLAKVCCLDLVERLDYNDLSTMHKKRLDNAILVKQCMEYGVKRSFDYSGVYRWPDFKWLEVY